jgi:hypothetical protein
MEPLRKTVIICGRKVEMFSLDGGGTWATDPAQIRARQQQRQKEREFGRHFEFNELEVFSAVVTILSARRSLFQHVGGGAPRDSDSGALVRRFVLKSLFKPVQISESEPVA